MKLEKSVIEQFDKDGFVLIPDVFNQKEIEILIAGAEELKIKNSPETICEDDQTTVRALMGCHLKSPLFKNLAKQSRLLLPVRQLLGDDEVYVYQFKINMKSSFTGEVWPWHQDFIYWHHLDGMPTDKVMNVALFLDDCTEFNGPLWVVPGSHKVGLLDCSDANRNEGKWSSDVSADLSFQIDQETLTGLVKHSGIASTKGQAGSILIFHPNLIHASLPNISPFPRKVAIITYNSINNVPIPKHHKRPDFLVNPDTSAETISEYPVALGQE